jgi:cytoskeleton protein RodZ
MRSERALPMSAFGENLRREREMRGVSLEEIASATKISLRFLHAIEAEDFAKLPGGIFGRSFIRSYARYLGLDEERVIAEFQLAAHPKGEVDLHRMPANNPAHPRREARTPLVATLVALILLAGGYALFRYSRRVAEAPAPPAPRQAETPTLPPPAQPATSPDVNSSTVGANPTGPSVAPGAAPAGTPGTTHGAAPIAPSRPGTAAGSATPSTSQPAVPSGTKYAQDADLVLQVAATERSWVAVEADGKTVFQRVLNPNEVETVKARESFNVTTGNAQGVILTLNGETLKPLGRRGEVKSIHITRDDLKTAAP